MLAPSSFLAAIPRPLPRKAQGARTFASAAQAIRFAFEEAAPVSLHGVLLRIGTASYQRDELAELYRSPAFPLPRKGDRHGSFTRPSRRRKTTPPGTQPSGDLVKAPRLH